MSFAWEVTADDVANVFNKHGNNVSPDDTLVNDAHDALDHDAVEEAVLAYTDFDDQTTAALSEIEDQLIEAGYVSAPKHWSNP